MSYSIQTNIASIRAQEDLRVNGDFQNRTINRLTSGYRINSSRDDAAGLAVANKFRGDITELNQGVRNANDGISALEIVDGGLNNISTMLDRLRTLAAQSASATFSGNRGTLNTEFQTLLTEINRQAANIGLSTGAIGGRYAKNFSVYVGGGSGLQSNAAANVSLAGSQVDSVGLSITGTNILGGGGVAVANPNNLNSGVFLPGSITQTIKFQFAGGVTKNCILQGTASGISGSDIVNQINTQMQSFGVSAAIDSTTGALTLYGDQNAFNYSVNATATPAQGIVSANAAGTNTNMYSGVGANLLAAFNAAGGNETITVGGQTYTAAVTAGDVTAGLAAVAKRLNDAFSGAGIYAVIDSAGTHIELQSSNQFTITADASTVFGATTTGTQGATNATYSSTANATSALAAITAAVTNLGNVQGKVGTAQNQLAYAVSLAQSQITSFSAAESRIRDTDVAAEAGNLTKAQVLQQASIAAMAQANSAPQAIMALLRG